MQKISYIRQLIQFLGLSIGIFLLSCGQLKTTRYIPQGEYAAPSEYMSSPVLKRPRNPPLNVGPLQLQTPVAKMKMSRGFRRGRKAHHGIDLTGHKNTPIQAAHPGVVVYAGRAFRGYGKMIILEYNEQWASLYAHLSRFHVKTGDIVQAGQLIGKMGSTGRSTGVHLHFELLHKRQPINPLPYLRPRSFTRR